MPEKLTYEQYLQLRELIKSIQQTKPHLSHVEVLKLALLEIAPPLKIQGLNVTVLQSGLYNLKQIVKLTKLKK